MSFYSAIRFIFVLFLFFYLSSCVSEQEEKSTQTPDPDFVEEKSTEPLWEYDIEKDNPVKKENTENGNRSIQTLLETVNLQYEDKVKLDYIRLGHDTLFLKIENADHLSRESGSLGAEAILSTIIFTLTESDSVNFVDLDFEEGDHAAPGTYTRDQFLKKSITP